MIQNRNQMNKKTLKNQAHDMHYYVYQNCSVRVKIENLITKHQMFKEV